MNLLSPLLSGSSLLLCAASSVSCTGNAPRLASGAGPEDLVRISYPQGENGRDGIVTATAKHRSLFSHNSNGQLELYRPGIDSGFEPVQTADGQPAPFYPSGIDYVPESRDKRWRYKALLYVGNSAAGSVEVFEIKGGKFIHLDQLGQNLDPNGIAAFPDGRVFVSRMRNFATSSDKPEVLSGRKLTAAENTISMYDPGDESGRPSSWSTVIQGLDGANGLAVGPGGRSLLFCSYHTGVVRSVPLDSHTGRPTGTPEVIYKASFKADNLKRLGEGRYSLCGQRGFLGVAGNFLLGLPTAPGDLVLLNHRPGQWEITARGEWLDGHRLAPSTGLVVGNTLYSGQPFSKGVFMKKIHAD